MIISMWQLNYFYDMHVINLIKGVSVSQLFRNWTQKPSFVLSPTGVFCTFIIGVLLKCIVFWNRLLAQTFIYLLVVHYQQVALLCWEVQCQPAVVTLRNTVPYNVYCLQLCYVKEKIMKTIVKLYIQMQGIVSVEELDNFIQHIKSPLPLTFRITGDSR